MRGKRFLILGLLLLMLLGMVVAVSPSESAAQEALRRSVARRLRRRWYGDQTRQRAFAEAKLQAIAGDRPPSPRKNDSGRLPVYSLEALHLPPVPPLAVDCEIISGESSPPVPPVPLYLEFCRLLI